MSISYFEMHGYPQESKDLDGFQATRKLLIDWDARYLLQDAMLAHPGHLYPYKPDYKARCVATAIQPLGKLDQRLLYPSQADYPHAVVTAQYKTPKIEDQQPYPQDLDPVKHQNPQAVLSEQIQPWQTTLTEEHTLYEWNSDSTALKTMEAPVRTVFREYYMLTRYNLPEVPLIARTLVGKINNAPVSPVLASGVTYLAKTLMFEPPTISMTANDAGERQFTVSYRMYFKEETWRKYWRGDPGIYDEIKVAGGSIVNLPEMADFSPLFP